jgi:D-aspartate ligase
MLMAGAREPYGLSGMTKQPFRGGPGMVPAIVLSGHTAALGVVRALAGMAVPVHVVHHEAEDYAQLSRYVMSHFRAPHPERQESAFVDLLLGIAGQVGHGVLFPVSDATLAAVARHKEELSKEYIVACPGWPVTQQCIDKGLSYSLAAKAGVPVPKTFWPEAAAEVEEFARVVSYPCLVKPRESHSFQDAFQTKMFVARNSDEIMAGYERARQAELGILLQELIPGEDSLVVNYNSYVVEGHPLAEFTAEHVRNGPPAFGSPRVVLSKAIPEVIEPGRRLLRAMGFDGYACIEFKKDPRDGKFKLMDINGRHNLSTSLAVRCGINFPYMEYRYRVFGETSGVREFTQCIYWIDIVQDIKYSVSGRDIEHYSARQLLRPYQSPHVFAIFNWKDPRPFLKKVALASRGIKGIVRRRGKIGGGGVGAAGLPQQTPARIEAASAAVPGAQPLPEDPRS